MDIIKVVILSSMFYIWFMPFLLAGAFIGVVKKLMEEKYGRMDFYVLGWTLFLIIIPFYCLLWRIAEYS